MCLCLSGAACRRNGRGAGGGCSFISLTVFVRVQAGRHAEEMAEVQEEVAAKARAAITAQVGLGG